MSASVRIPFLDLASLHVALEEQLCDVFRGALRRGSFIGGAMLSEFEAEFAQYCDSKYCVGVANGTDALRFALIAAGVKQGDAAITVPHTFIATTEAISQAGALPVFVDIDERTYNMDPAKLERYLEERCDFAADTHAVVDRRSGRRVTAIVPVHIYGQMADMDAILEIARRYDLLVIEDACQAHGAEYFSARENRWRKAGSMGLAAAFSFYPGKNLGACGEAGAVTTSDAELAQKIRMLRDHGQARKYYHEIEGYNGRLDAIQAGILKVKLRYLPSWTEQRTSAAACYRRLLRDCEEAIVPYEPAWARPVYHLFVVRVPDRDGLMYHLADVGIGTGIHYPVPLHLQNAYRGLGHSRGEFPVSEKIAEEIVSLPLYPGITGEQQVAVIEAAAEFVRQLQPASLL